MNKPVCHKNQRSIVAFRTDASLEIGSGHVMRCLTLAAALREQGAECHFLCREHPGHLISMIESRGFIVHRLAMTQQTSDYMLECDVHSGYAHWLGASWQTDAKVCLPLLAQLTPGWLVVDHYALDARWEESVLPEATHLLVIDDLADRPHCADLLLDQNLGREVKDYADLVPAKCRVLAGPHFALLRPEFAALREKSLARRAQKLPFKRLLISLGGVDKDNVTGQVLSALRDCDLPDGLGIEVVMGATAPWLDEVHNMACTMPRPTNVVVNISDMARRMADADLAIGAAGSTSWERCCLGVPTLMIVLAENQKSIAVELEKAGASITLEFGSLPSSLSRHWANITQPDSLAQMSDCAAQVSDGYGACRVAEAFLEIPKQEN